jgi:hypothetical protein
MQGGTGVPPFSFGPKPDAETGRYLTAARPKIAPSGTITVLPR